MTAIETIKRFATGVPDGMYWPSNPPKEYWQKKLTGLPQRWWDDVVQPLKTLYESPYTDRHIDGLAGITRNVETFRDKRNGELISCLKGIRMKLLMAEWDKMFGREPISVTNSEWKCAIQKAEDYYEILVEEI